MEDSKISNNIWNLMSQYSEEDHEISKHKIMPFYNTERYHSQIPGSIVELDDQRFKGSAFGCLVLQGYTTSKSILIDLASKKKWDLPRVERYQKVVLTSKPTEHNCRVLFHDGRNMTLMFCRPGDTQVIQRKDFTDMLQNRNDELDSPVLYQGQIYCISFPDIRLLRVKFSDSSLGDLQLVEETEAFPQCFGTCCAYCLVESGKDLLLIETNYTTTYPQYQVYGFKVYKLDAGRRRRSRRRRRRRRRRWVEVNDIGDYAILRSSHNCASSVYAPHNYQIKKNCIYYFVKYDSTLYVYDLERGVAYRESYMPHLDAVVHSKFADIQWLTLPATINLG